MRPGVEDEAWCELGGLLGHETNGINIVTANGALQFIPTVIVCSLYKKRSFRAAFQDGQLRR